jgi:hypothetical protein
MNDDTSERGMCKGLEMSFVDSSSRTFEVFQCRSFARESNSQIIASAQM